MKFSFPLPGKATSYQEASIFIQQQNKIKQNIQVQCKVASEVFCLVYTLQQSVVSFSCNLKGMHCKKFSPGVKPLDYKKVCEIQGAFTFTFRRLSSNTYQQYTGVDLLEGEAQQSPNILF